MPTVTKQHSKHAAPVEGHPSDSYVTSNSVYNLFGPYAQYVNEMWAASPSVCCIKVQLLEGILEPPKS